MCIHDVSLSFFKLHEHIFFGLNMSQDETINNKQVLGPTNSRPSSVSEKNIPSKDSSDIIDAKAFKGV